MSNAAVKTRPPMPDFPDGAAVYDWLKANGVDEWLPEGSTITLDRDARTITYTSFVWEGPRGWDAMNFRADDVAAPTERRTVPLLVEPDADTARVLAKFG